jgi:2',3'-cyclic-nucleotide 2'-phosphodiesterase (5'-nucleotidase family)
MYTADVHEGLPEYPVLAALVRSERRRSEDAGVPTLYVDAGDSTDAMVPASDLSRGRANFAMLAAAGCDAANVGEGDAMRWGPDNVTGLASHVVFPLLGANLRGSRGRVWPGITETAIIERGGIRVGVFGLTVMFPSVYERFGCTQLHPAEVVPRLVRRLRRQGADLILCVSHCGLAEEIEVVRRHQGIDLLISSHSHDTPIFGTIQIGSTAVVHPGADVEYVGRADLEEEGTGWRVQARLLPFPRGAAPDPAVEAEWERWKARTDDLLAEVVGQASTSLPMRQDRRCPAGDLVCRALCERMQAEAAVLFSGHLRRSLPGGVLRRRDVWALVPGSASPGVVELGADQLRQMIRNALMSRTRPSRAINREHVGYLQSANLTWEEAGDELHVFLNGQPLRRDSRQRVAATDLELGLARRFQLLDPGVADTADIEVTSVLREVVEDYVRRHSPLAPTQTAASLAG